MDAIETLMNEHRVIERVLDALTAFADEARRQGTTTRTSWRASSRSSASSPTPTITGRRRTSSSRRWSPTASRANGGPIAVMLHEHDQGRALVGVLAGGAPRRTPWSDADRQEIADAAHAFSDLLHAHIHKEDAILYPMAEQRLPPEAMEQVGRRVRALEQKQTGAGEHERFHALADELVLRHAATSHPAADATPPRPRPRLLRLAAVRPSHP